MARPDAVELRAPGLYKELVQIEGGVLGGKASRYFVSVQSLDEVLGSQDPKDKKVRFVHLRVFDKLPKFHPNSKSPFRVYTFHISPDRLITDLVSRRQPGDGYLTLPSVNDLFYFVGKAWEYHARNQARKNPLPRISEQEWNQPYLWPV